MTPVPIHIPMAVLTLPTLTGARSPAGFGAGGLQPDECCSLGLAWECVLHPATLVLLAVPMLLPFPAGHAAAWESQRGARVGTAAFASAPVPGVSKGSQPGCPQSTLGWHRCHWLSLAVAFFPGVGVPGFGVSPIFPGTTSSSASQHTPRACVGARPAHRDMATGRGGSPGAGLSRGAGLGGCGEEK